MMEFKKKYNVMLNSLRTQMSVYEVTEKCAANVEAENDAKLIEKVLLKQKIPYTVVA